MKDKQDVYAINVIVNVFFELKWGDFEGGDFEDNDFEEDSEEEVQDNDSEEENKGGFNDNN